MADELLKLLLSELRTILRLESEAAARLEGRSAEKALPNIVLVTELQNNRARRNQRT